MASNQIANARLGQRFADAAVPTSWLGVPKELQFVGPPTDGSNVIDANDNPLGCTAILVQNNTGGNIPAGSLVNLDLDTTFPTSIDDETATVERAHGVTDPFAGVLADNEYGWVIIGGMCKYKLPTATASVTAGDKVVPHATEDGRISPIDATPDNDAAAMDQAIVWVGQVLETSDVEDALVLGYFRPVIY